MIDPVFCLSDVADPEAEAIIGDVLRGQTVGTCMMAMAEDEARRRGCRSVGLYTIRFQARGFYRHLGWTVFGEVPCDPPGTSRAILSNDFMEPSEVAS